MTASTYARILGRRARVTSVRPLWWQWVSPSADCVLQRWKITGGEVRRQRRPLPAVGLLLPPATEYYYQSVFYDYAYPGASSTGRVTADSYWDRNVVGVHDGVYTDYHIKFCIPTGTSVETC